MDKEELVDKKWDVLQKIFKYMQEYMNLTHWDISWEWFKKWELWEHTEGRLERLQYNYFLAEILFDNTLLFEKVDEFYLNELFRILVHELCHIYTGVWNAYFKDDVNSWNLALNIWRANISEITNSLIFVEEQMTNLLDDVIYWAIKKEDKFKKLHKEFIKLNNLQ